MSLRWRCRRQSACMDMGSPFLNASIISCVIEQNTEEPVTEQVLTSIDSVSI